MTTLSRSADSRAAWNAVERLSVYRGTVDLAIDLANLLGDPRVHAALLLVAQEEGHEGGLYSAAQSAMGALYDAQVKEKALRSDYYTD